jgi:2-oxoglutarate dehydrogenase E2 component (dihydrolipoamide succinyltransferase)
VKELTTVVVAMPHMGVSVEEGTVIEWHKSAGDEVAAEELICEIATDKVDTEVFAPADGVLTRIAAAAGTTVAVGEPLAELSVHVAAVAGTEPSAEPDPPAAPAPAVPAGGGDVDREEAGGEIAVRAAAGHDGHGRFDPAAAALAVTGVARAGSLASPVARRIAAEHGIDLGTVSGSGVRGRIRKADVLAVIGGDRAAATATAVPPGGLPPGYDGVPHEVLPTSRIRQAIAAHMIRSRQTAAHMTTEVDVDLGAVIRARAELNAPRLAAGAAKLSFLPFIARAACVALGEYPGLNSTFLQERTIRWQTVNLGVAVDTPEGLLVPVIRGCDRLTAPAIGDAIVDLAERARTRKLRPDDLAGGTFTISNPGSVGAVSAPAIINQPQTAILGVPAIARRPWVLTDEFGAEAIAIRSILRLAVTFDHRAVDGADATRFAVSIKSRLEAWGTEAYT